MYGLSAGTKKSGRCEEVCVSGGSTVCCTQKPIELLSHGNFFPPKKRSRSFLFLKVKGLIPHENGRSTSLHDTPLKRKGKRDLIRRASI